MNSEFEMADCGEIFATDDDLVEQLRKRAAFVGASYGTIDALTGLGEGSTNKYLSDARVRVLTISSALRVCAAVGLRMQLVVDEALSREMQPEWGNRDGRRCHARRLPTLGKVQLRRFLAPVAREMGARGGRARQAAMTPAERREFGRRGAAVRWKIKNLIREPGDVWVDAGPATPPCR
jgi:hypothetical protein